MGFNWVQATLSARRRVHGAVGDPVRGGKGRGEYVTLGCPSVGNEWVLIITVDCPMGK